MADDLETGGPSLEGEKFASTLRVRPGANTEALLALARANAADPSIFEDTPPYFWSVEGSSTKEDAYSTLMHPSTLKNFAADATAGISFQNSHRTDELGFGRTLQGRFIGAGGNGVARMEADLFTTPGLNLNGVSTDDLIRGIRSGLVKDVSVGFYLGPDGFYRCNLCQERLLTRGCFHYPGMLYPTEEREGAALAKATATIHNAHLAEISAVYDGATPSAGVLKARWAMEEGSLPPEVARQLETCYRIKLPASHRSWPGTTRREEASMPDKEGQGAPTNDTPTDTGILQAFHRSIGDALKDVGAPLGPDSLTAATIIRSLGAELVELRPLKDKVEQQAVKIADLEPRAKDGDAYRQATVNDTWGEYNRAGLAEGVNEEEQKALWQRAPLAQVKKEQESYRKLGDARCAGGRLTVDQGDPKPNETPAASPVPLHLYVA